VRIEQQQQVVASLRPNLLSKPFKNGAKQSVSSRRWLDAGWQMPVFTTFMTGYSSSMIELGPILRVAETLERVCCS
jgi:hypothetical protein